MDTLAKAAKLFGENDEFSKDDLIAAKTTELEEVYQIKGGTRNNLAFFKTFLDTNKDGKLTMDDVD